MENKIIQSILFIVRSSKDLNKYSLSKMLYYADALHYRKYSETITGKSYIHIEYSPIPKGMNEIVSYMITNKLLLVRPAIKNEKVTGMVFDNISGPNLKEFSKKELKTLRYICFLLGKKIDDESRVFPRLYEHYIITDLFTEINFKTLPREKPPKISRKLRLIEIGDKIYKILFER